MKRWETVGRKRSKELGDAEWKSVTGRRSRRRRRETKRQKKVDSEREGSGGQPGTEEKHRGYVCDV